ncbi:uncharacterized protein [Taeniopygia guttata]|uniref:uncharacterized protein n=1 Tax=Taeniopygia guttata TaxID=59729 RepID=UPI003BB9274D
MPLPGAGARRRPRGPAAHPGRGGRQLLPAHRVRRAGAERDPPGAPRALGAGRAPSSATGRSLRPGGDNGHDDFTLQQCEQQRGTPPTSPRPPGRSRALSPPARAPAQRRLRLGGFAPPLTRRHAQGGGRRRRPEPGNAATAGPLGAPGPAADPPPVPVSRREEAALLRPPEPGAAQEAPPCVCVCVCVCLCVCVYARARNGGGGTARPGRGGATRGRGRGRGRGWGCPGGRRRLGRRFPRRAELSAHGSAAPRPPPAGRPRRAGGLRTPRWGRGRLPRSRSLPPRRGAGDARSPRGGCAVSAPVPGDAAALPAAVQHKLIIHTVVPEFCGTGADPVLVVLPLGWLARTRSSRSVKLLFPCMKLTPDTS